MRRIAILAVCCSLLLAACRPATGARVTPEPAAYPGPSALPSVSSVMATPAPTLGPEWVPPVPPTPTAAATSHPPVAWRELVTYTNDILGLSFAYPAELGEVEFGSGPTSFTLRFSNYGGLSFHGISADYTAGRGTMLSDSQGYYHDAGEGRYYARGPADHVLPVTPARILDAHDGEPILLFDQTSGVIGGWGETLAAHEYTALANLRGATFRGMFVWNRDGLVLPLETFEALLGSFVTRTPSR